MVEKQAPEQERSAVAPAAKKSLWKKLLRALGIGTTFLLCTGLIIHHQQQSARYHTAVSGAQQG